MLCVSARRLGRLPPLLPAFPAGCRRRRCLDRQLHPLPMIPAPLRRQYKRTVLPICKWSVGVPMARGLKRVMAKARQGLRQGRQGRVACAGEEGKPSMRANSRGGGRGGVGHAGARTRPRGPTSAGPRRMAWLAARPSSACACLSACTLCRSR